MSVHCFKTACLGTPISVCGKYANTAIKYEEEYYKALEYIDYCFATGKNLDSLSSDDKICWVMSHIYDIGEMIDVNTLNAMTITSNLINKTGSNPDAYMPLKGFTRADYINGTAANFKLTTSLMKKETEISNHEFIESVYGKDAADAQTYSAHCVPAVPELHCRRVAWKVPWL